MIYLYGVTATMLALLLLCARGHEDGISKEDLRLIIMASALSWIGFALTVWAFTYFVVQSFKKARHP